MTIFIEKECRKFIKKELKNKYNMLTIKEIMDAEFKYMESIGIIT